MSDVSVAGYLLAVPVDFRIALARIRFSHHAVLSLQAGDVMGVGEGVLYRTLLHQAGTLFQHSVRPRLEEDGLPNGDPEVQERWLSRLAGACPALAFAVDTALWDLRGKKAGCSVAKLLRGPHRRHIPITEQVFIRDWPSAERELEALLSRGTRWIKVKIGVDPKSDLEAIRRVRSLVGAGIGVRVDANHAYTLEQAEPLYAALAEYGVLAVEEPLGIQDWADLRTLRQRLGVSVILDESILSLDDLHTAIAEDAIDILNIKLTRVGGISQALRYAGVCSQNGIEVAVGCSEELGVGTAAIAHLAAGLSDVHSVEGLGPQRLGFDLIAQQWLVRDGMITLPEGTGLGVTLPKAWTEWLPQGVRCFSLLDGGWRLELFSRYAYWLQRGTNLAWRTRRRIGK